MNTPESAVVYYPAPEKPLTPEELRAVIGRALDANPPLAAALRQMLGERLASCTVATAHARATAEERSYIGGQTAEVLRIQGELAKALKAAAELRGHETGRSGPPRRTGR